MKRFWLTAASVLLLAACGEGPMEAPRPQFDDTGRQENPRYIVRFANGQVNASGETDRLVRTHRGRLAYRYSAAIRGFAGEFSAADIAALARDPSVIAIERDQLAHAVGTQLNPPSWGLDRIDQSLLPLSSSYTYGTSGTGVRVHILDTGILLSHSDFGGRAVAGLDAITPGGSSIDCAGHGTHVAGTVGGSSFGVAKGVTLVAVRVLDCTGTGSYSQVIAGVDWVTQQKLANASVPMVANMSLGGPVSSALNAAVANSIAAGVTYAVAAGNDTADACNKSPAAAPNAITVGSTNILDTRATSSNFGSCLDIFAPGVGITSAWYTGNSATNTISGTSMASPHVAGAAALYLESNPAASPATVTAALITNATLNTVINPGTGSPNRLLYTGFITGPPTGNQPPVSRPVVTCVGMTCTFDGRGSTDDVGVVAYEWHPGDASIVSTQALWSMTFLAARTRTWSLTVRDAGGLSHTQSVSFTVPGTVGPPAPVANFTFSCTNLNCSFDGSTSTAQPGASFSWAWGDGTPNGGGQTATHAFALAGSYSVTLTVSDAGGTGTRTQTVVVTAPPTGNQPPVSRPVVTCVGMTCTFDGRGSTDDVGVVAYEWHPGDASIVSTQALWSMTFLAARTRTWSLTVRDAGGLSHTQSFSFTVPGTVGPPVPVANFTFSCTNLSCSFDGSGSTAQAGASFSWAWGDGSPNGSGQTATHAFALAGSYSVTLTVSDAGGTGTRTQTVVVTAPPTGNQPPVSRPVVMCVGMTCTFDGRGSTDDVGVVAWEWHPGDASIVSTQQLWSMTFLAGRTRTWSLTVRDAAGLSHTQSFSFTVPSP